MQLPPRLARSIGPRPDGDRPITIEFDLDPAAAVDGVWTLEINSELLQLFRRDMSIDGGEVIIDGNTQTGGRNPADGPKIMVNTNDYSFQIQVPNNEVRNLGFYGGGRIELYEGNNIIENIWMGLSNDGQEIVFRTPSQPNRMAGGGITLYSDDNIIQNNVIAGTFANAINIDGTRTNNRIQNNAIGTRADGTVPTPYECTGGVYDANSWYGGWGIGLSGNNNQVIGNRIVALDNVRSTNDTVPLAIAIFGNNHEVRDNIIGVDSAGNKVGTCGLGIQATGTGSDILDNTIVNSRVSFEDDVETAIFASGAISGITVRGNLVENGPGEIYDFGGTQVPQALRIFRPARITGIDGVNITGASGEDSPCPNCIIDFYLDNNDDIAEAFEYLGTTTADNEGNFTFQLDDPLPSDNGIRTTSTTQALNVIDGMGSGTTTRNSRLYLPVDTITITLPLTASVGITVPVVINVGPQGATTPFDYTIEATDRSPATVTDSDSYAVSGNITWDEPGEKTLTVTVTNELSSFTASQNITIEPGPEPEAPDWRLLIPYIQR